jgi:hypothetical protein
MSNGNNTVNIRIDSRVLYGLLAVLAVVGIFAIGLWLGNQLGGDTTQTASNQPATFTTPGAAIVNAPEAGATIVNGAPNNTVQQVPQNGSPPADPNEVPVDAGQPRIWIPEPSQTNWEYDLGAISPSEKAEHDFEIQNVGNATLEISDASASCGCTAAVVEDTTIEPGESTTVRVTYDPTVNQEAGKTVTKQIRIKSNDPVVPLAEFNIIAEVQAQ